MDIGPRDRRRTDSDIAVAFARPHRRVGDRDNVIENRHDRGKLRLVVPGEIEQIGAIGGEGILRVDRRLICHELIGDGALGERVADDEVPVPASLALENRPALCDADLQVRGARERKPLAHLRGQDVVDLDRHLVCLGMGGSERSRKSATGPSDVHGPHLGPARACRLCEDSHVLHVFELEMLRVVEIDR